MTRLIVVWCTACLVLDALPSAAQTAETLEARVTRLEDRLRDALAEVELLSRELRDIRNPVGRRTVPAQQMSVADDAPPLFENLVTGSARDIAESTRPLAAKPDMFFQGRFSTLPIEGATLDDYSANFRVSRMSMRWAGMLDERWGAAVELQYRAAPDNVPEQLLNDAYVDLHLSKALVIRTGHFVKPFGFDVQQPDHERESPERAMFAGYVFPGLRDRGVMVTGELGALCQSCQGLSYAVAAVNGNRFFDDSNRRANYLFRLRRLRDRLGLGASVQLGTQIVPPGVAQTGRENVYGVDGQWSVGRLGLRAEFVHAYRPSTLLAPDPIFAPAFVEGRRVRSVATSVSGLWSLAPGRQAYVRFDRLAGDVVQLCPTAKDGSCKITAINGGVRQRIAGRGDISVDLQWKDRLSFNHDAVNTKLQITSSLSF